MIGENDSGLLDLAVSSLLEPIVNCVKGYLQDVKPISGKDFSGLCFWEAIRLNYFNKEGRNLELVKSSFNIDPDISEVAALFSAGINTLKHVEIASHIGIEIPNESSIYYSNVFKLIEMRHFFVMNLLEH